MIANILISTSLQDMFANKLKQHIPENIRKQTGSLLSTHYQQVDSLSV